MNFYTKGGEYYFQNNQQYIGYFHIIKGTAYTGIKHVYGVSKKLYKPSKTEKIYTDQGLKYKALIQKHYVNINPIILAIVPSKSQWQQNIHTLYILKHKKTQKIYQVNKTCYENYITSNQYKTFMIKRKNGLNDSDIIYNKNQLKNIKDKTVQNYLKQKRGF